ERAVKLVKRRPAPAALGAVTFAAVLGVAALVMWHYWHLRQTLDETRAELNDERLAATRARVQSKVAQGESALAREDWREARSLFSTALELIESEPSLEDLTGEARSGLAGAERQLAREAARWAAVARREEFDRRLDDVRFHATLLTGLNRTANVQETREAVRGALGLFGMADDSVKAPAFPDGFTEEEKGAVTRACYELLLFRAEAVAHPLPGED